MASITTITFAGITSDDMRAINFALAEINAARVAQQLSPFATMVDFLKDHIAVTMLNSWKASEAASSQTAQAKALWQVATDQQRAAAIAALQA